jgi:hypothetical protein
MIGLDHDLEGLEFRHVAGDRIVEAPLALFEQDHHGHAGHRLGHGIDAEDLVLRHGLTGLEAGLPVGLELDDLAVAGEQRGHAGDPAVRDDLGHGVVQALQPRAVEADGFRAGGRRQRGLDGALAGGVGLGAGEQHGRGHGRGEIGVASHPGSPPKYLVA